MAAILYQMREEVNRSLLENGTSGVGGLQSGELGFNDDSAALEFSYRRRNGAGFVHVPTWEGLGFHGSASVSGSKGIGYYPTSPLTATDVQTALDQLAALGGGGGGGGGVGGSGTIGNIPKFTATNAVGNSILAEASGKITFNGDTAAALYQVSTGILGVTGQLSVANALSVGGNILVGGTGTFNADIYGGGNVNVAFDIIFNADSVANLYRSAAGVVKSDGTILAAVLKSSGDIAAVGQLIFNADSAAALHRASSGVLGVTGQLSVANALSVGGNISGGGTGTFSADIYGGGNVNVAFDIIFNADSVANLYRSGAGALATDASLRVAAQTQLGSSLTFGNAQADLSPMHLMTGTVTKTDALAKTFYGHLIKPIFNVGGSQSGGKVVVFGVDSTNTNVTGLGVDLMTLSYGGTERHRVDSFGRVSVRAGTNNNAIVHIIDGGFASAGLAGFANANCLTLENNDDTGLTILVPATKKSWLNFGKPANINQGAIYYDMNNDTLNFFLNGNTRASFGSTGNLSISGQVLTSRRTGWTAWTGTATRSGFATSSATITNVAETVKALIDDLSTHGLIGT